MKTASGSTMWIKTRVQWNLSIKAKAIFSRTPAVRETQMSMLIYFSRVSASNQSVGNLVTARTVLTVSYYNARFKVQEQSVLFFMCRFTHNSKHKVKMHLSFSASHLWSELNLTPVWVQRASGLRFLTIKWPRGFRWRTAPLAPSVSSWSITPGNLSNQHVKGSHVGSQPS